MMDTPDSRAGKPGQPGESGTSQRGGAGGAGGTGGEGQTEGGPGGSGGAGGQMGSNGKRRVGMWVYAVLVVIAAVSIGVIGWQVRAQSQKIEKTADETHRAVCAMRANTEGQVRDAQAQIESTLKFLQSHPGPEPIQGVSREVLKEGLTRQRGTLQRQEAFVAAIAFVSCP